MSIPQFTPDLLRIIQKLEDDLRRTQADVVALQENVIGGGDGPGGSTYIHTQSVASDTWTITHNLNRYPAVTTVDTTDKEVVGAVSYQSANILIVTFSAAMAGRAFLN